MFNQDTLEGCCSVEVFHQLNGLSVADIKEGIASAINDSKGFVIATTSTESRAQRAAAVKLAANGFSKKGSFISPSTGNTVTLWTHKITKAEVKKYRDAREKCDCGDPNCYAD